MKRYILLEESDEGGGGCIGIIPIVIFNMMFIAGWTTLASILTGIIMAILFIYILIQAFTKKFKRIPRALAGSSLALGTYAVCFNFPWLIVSVMLGILTMVVKIAVEGPTPITKRIFEVLLWLEILSFIYAFWEDYWWAIPCVIIGLLMLIVWLIQKAIEKKEAKLEAKARAESERKAAEEKEFLEITSQLLKAETEKRRAELIEMYTADYKNNPRAISLAQDMVGHFIQNIQNAKRDVRTPTIAVSEYRYASYNIKSSSDITNLRIEGIDFIKENLKPIDDELQLLGFMDAIVTNAEEIFKKTYASTHPKDISGTQYTFQTKKNRREDAYKERIDYFITLSYEAPNGYYQAPKEWL